jgi:hypothetical protein
MYLRSKDTDTIELGLSLEQLKKIYVALFSRLHDSRFAAIDELDEDDMLLTIQTCLQREARKAGVDCTDHSAWEAFLGIQDAPTCEQRFAGRKEE